MEEAVYTAPPRNFLLSRDQANFVSVLSLGRLRGFALGLPFLLELLLDLTLLLQQNLEQRNTVSGIYYIICKILLWWEGMREWLLIGKN